MTRTVWRCECGKMLVSGLEGGRCPHCRSAFGTYSGRVIVTKGSWEILSLDDGRRLGFASADADSVPHG